MKAQKILITGGAGYIGSVLTEYLLKEGHDVTIVDLLMWGQSSLLHFAHHPNFHFISGDCRDKNLMQKLVPDADIIIPLAALVGMPLCEKRPLDAVSTNYEAVELINTLRDKEKQKVIYPTTNSGYGTKSGETYCTEETPLEPISLYGETKVKAEALLLNSPNTITLRLATVFGMSTRMRFDLLVNDFVYKAVKDGYVVLYEAHFKRNYVHIRDVARCFLHCIENFDKMKGQAYNVGLDSANLSKLELAEKIKTHVPKFYIALAETGSDPDKRNYIVSNAKLLGAGFNCSFSLDDGIKEIIKGIPLIPLGINRNA